jgi:hypothetical protein
MNRTEERPERLSDASLDRLVDGDLPDSERRELLRLLESEPGGWRRCALAFLEHQAWRNALTEVAPPVAMPTPGPSPGRRDRSWARRAAIAATVLVSTFAGGFAAGGLGRHTTPPVFSKADPAGQPAPVSSPQSSQVYEVGQLQLVETSAGESPPQRYPIRSGPGMDEQWLRSQPPSVPDYVRVRLEREGYQVAERRKLVSLEVGDGRRVSIPVDEVEVDFVGQRPL